MVTVLAMPAGVDDDKTGKYRERQNHFSTSSKDSDGDSMFDQNDNCPQVKNPGQVLNNSKLFGVGWCYTLYRRTLIGMEWATLVTTVNW
jgi:hypothetical protein